MKRTNTYERKIGSADPPLSTSTKLDQIRSGAKLKRQTAAKKIKDVVIHGKNGAKITKKTTQEKYEESSVVRKKRNYVMYESKLGTNSNTEVTKIEGQKKSIPKPVRQPSPRKEEKIIITKKRKDYLDNYQYKETKVIKDKNPKKISLVEHQRLGDIIGGFYEETTYQTQTFNYGGNLPRIQNRGSKTNLNQTFSGRFRDNKPNRSNSKRNDSYRSVKPSKNSNYSSSNVNRRIDRNNTNSSIDVKVPRNRPNIKTDIALNQIMPRRPQHIKDYHQNTYNPKSKKIVEKPKKDGKNNIKATTRKNDRKEEKKLNKSFSKKSIDKSREKSLTKTSISISKRSVREESISNSKDKNQRRKSESKVEKKVEKPRVINNLKVNSIRNKYKSKH